MDTQITQELGLGSGQEARGLTRPVEAKWVYAWLLVVAVGVIWLRLPIALDFKMFGFYDPGAALKADAFLWEGRRPTVDFAYSYGLLPLEVGDVWYRVFGRTPWGHERLIAAMSLVLVAGMARLGVGLRWNRVALGLAVLALPVALTEVYLNQTHVMEAALLTWALVFQARGQKKWALALVAVCTFVKPSMAYAYGLILVVLMMRDFLKERARWQKGVMGFLPAVVVWTGLAGALMMFFGWVPLARTLVPLNVRESYRAAHFGFFIGVGRDFWWRPHGDYFSTVAAFWIAATVLVTGLGLGIMFRRRVHAPAPPASRGLWPEFGRETFLCMVAMHLIFILFLYAWADSWTYYAFLLVMAAATAVNLCSARWQWKWTAGLTVLLLILLSFKVSEWTSAWSRYHGADTDGLWAYETMLADWKAAREAAAGEKTLWLVNGDLAEMFPGMVVPESWFMGPAFLTAGELAAVKKQIGEADVVVRFAENGDLDPWLWETFREETAKYHEVLSNGHFIVEVRQQAEGNRQ